MRDSNCGSLTFTAVLTDDERAEYAELGAAYRNDDNISVATSALLLPVSFGAVAVIWQSPQLFFPLLSVSYVSFFVHALYLGRLQDYTMVRLRRMRWLETKGQMDHHRAIDRAISAGEIRGPRVRALHFALGILLAFGWAITAAMVAAHQLPVR